MRRMSSEGAKIWRQRKRDSRWQRNMYGNSDETNTVPWSLAFTFLPASHSFIAHLRLSAFLKIALSPLSFVSEKLRWNTIKPRKCFLRFSHRPRPLCWFFNFESYPTKPYPTTLSYPKLPYYPATFFLFRMRNSSRCKMLLHRDYQRFEKGVARDEIALAERERK